MRRKVIGLRQLRHRTCERKQLMVPIQSIISCVPNLMQSCLSWRSFKLRTDDRHAFRQKKDTLQSLSESAEVLAFVAKAAGLRICLSSDNQQDKHVPTWNESQ